MCLCAEERDKGQGTRDKEEKIPEGFSVGRERRPKIHPQPPPAEDIEPESLQPISLKAYSLQPTA
jgi:hypothetical protein